MVPLFVRKDDQQIKGVADLFGRKLAAVKNNIGLFMFKKRKDITVGVYADLNSAFFNLLSGDADALVYPGSVVHALPKRQASPNT